MDQRKVGSFLKELRREKGITQEQLAEQLNVSGRTVSRWETGSNMPDISILVELAELHGVTIPEIIDGERKSENMNKEVKETALALSEYAENINRNIRKRLLWLTVAAIIGTAVFLTVESLGLGTEGSFYERIASIGLGLNLGMLVVMLMYFSGALGRIKARRMMCLEARKNR